MSKQPATPNGFHDASTDAEVIRGWWAEWPDANVALSPEAAGWAVVDIDGAAGEAAWAASDGGPRTFTVQTPRGGRHLYYSGSVAASASKIAEHVDTRGRGSYVLVPPSRTPEGVYTLVDDRDLADLPAWVEEAAGRQREIAKGAGIEYDLPFNVARTIGFLKARLPAIEGSGGDAWTLETAFKCRDLGCSPTMTAALMIEHWNPRCEPPWLEDELELKVNNAFTYPQNEAGAWAVAPAVSTFATVLDKLGIEYRREPKRERFQPWTAQELIDMPPIDWIIPQMIPERSIGMLYGPPDSYKTFAVLTQVLEVSRTKDVIFLAGEGGYGLGPRIKAWATLHEIDVATLKFHAVTDMPKAADRGDVSDFVEKMRKRGIKPAIVCVDTASRMMTGLDESSARDAGQFIDALDFLKEEFGCTILAIHHTGKDVSKGERGSSALRGGFDFVIEAEATTDTNALALVMRKVKDAERRREPFTFELRALAGSLVLMPTTADQHRKLTQKEAGNTDPAKVGGALVKMDAIEDEAAVTTFALAHELVPDTGKPADERHAELERFCRVLRAHSRSSLVHYCFHDGKELKWRIPPHS